MLCLNASISMQKSYILTNSELPLRSLSSSTQCNILVQKGLRKVCTLILFQYFSSYKSRPLQNEFNTWYFTTIATAFTNRHCLVNLVAAQKSRTIHILFLNSKVLDSLSINTLGRSRLFKKIDSYFVVHFMRKGWFFNYSLFIILIQYCSAINKNIKLFILVNDYFLNGISQYFTPHKSSQY